MGLSASQARLLSITQRINNNELESEMISNAKIQLAARNTIASENYINALDGTKLEYISYDDSGTQEKVNLTFNSINQYTPLKNQYALFNNENQIYVSATDAANFENSDNLYEFLECYGLFDRGKDEYDEKMQEYKDQMDEYNKEKDEYDKALGEYNNQMNDYNEKLNDYNEKLQDYNDKLDKYHKDYQEYLESLNEPNAYDTFSGIVGTSDSPQSCYSAALRNPLGQCYRHVLGYLIDPSTTGGDYKTSAGDTIHVSYSDVSGSTLSVDGKGNQLSSVRDIMKEQDSSGEYKKKCDGDDDLNTEGKQNSLQTIIDAGGTPSKLDQLLSDFIYDPTTNSATEVKSLYQKAIDMIYVITHQSEFAGELTEAKMKDVLINFTDGDMKNLATEPTPPDPIDPFTEVPPTMEIAAPQEPEMPEYTDKIYDKPLAQWYTNLWYIMDGNLTSDEIYSVYDEQAEFDYFTVPNVSKTSTEDSNNYVVISDDLAGNQEWLQFAINNGLVTLSQATLKNDTNSTNIRWEGIEYSSTSDIYESQDETKIAKAEAEYQKTLTEIQAEDKQLDIEIKKLDTEHSALEKELESIKGVMQKNTERSFSAFS